PLSFMSFWSFRSFASFPEGEVQLCGRVGQTPRFAKYNSAVGWGLPHALRSTTSRTSAFPRSPWERTGGVSGKLGQLFGAGRNICGCHLRCTGVVYRAVGSF